LAEGMSKAEWTSLLKALDKLSVVVEGVAGDEEGASAD
jgi:hypothetical protein